MPNHILGDGGLRHLDSNLPQFPMNARSSPARVGETHLPNQIGDFRRYRRAIFATPTLPSPIEAKSLAMPGDDRLWLDQEQRRTPIVPQSGEPNPRDSIRPAKTQLVTAARTLQDQELVAESKTLCLQNDPGYESRLCKCNDFNANGLFGRDRVRGRYHMVISERYYSAIRGVVPRRKRLCKSVNGDLSTRLSYDDQRILDLNRFGGSMSCTEREDLRRKRASPRAS